MKKKLGDNIFLFCRFYHVENSKWPRRFVDTGFCTGLTEKIFPCFFFSYINFYYFRTSVTFGVFKTVRTIDVKPVTNRTFSKDQRIRYDDNHARRAWLFQSGERCTPTNRGRYEFRNLLDCRNCLITFQ